MAKTIVGMMTIFLTLGSFSQVLAGDWTAHGFIYKPSLGARGTVEKGRYDSGQDRVDARLNKEIWVGDPNYGTTIQDALTAISSNQAILRVPAGTHSISGNLIVPSNVTLGVERRATLAIPQGVTLTINGNLDAGSYQIFSCTGTGKVIFGAGAFKDVLPQWFGAKGDGITDDTAAIQAAFNSLPAAATGWRMRFPAGTYYVTAAITLPGASTGQIPVYITGDGAILSTDQAISIFKRWPTEATANSFTNKGFVIDGLVFQGTSLRSQVGLDLGATYGAKITNCRFINLGRGLRLTYGLMCEVSNCLATNCVIAGFTAHDGYGLWSATHTWASTHVIYRSCRVFTPAATNAAIAGMTRANPCVVTWTGHGLSTGDIVFIDGITQTGWTAMNHRRFQITKIDDNSFSLQVMDRTDAGANFNTSAYAGDYVPATDPGVIQAAVFGFEEINTYGDTLENCITEGNNPTDNIFFYSLSAGESFNIKNHYVENAPFGSSLYLNYAGGKINLDGFGSNYGTVIIDTYDMASNTFGVVEVKDYLKGSGTIRLPQDNADSYLYWIFNTSGGYGYGYDMLTASYWYQNTVPSRVSNYLSQGKPIIQGAEVWLQGGRGSYVKQETNYGGVYYPGANYQGLRSEANALGGGGVGAHDITNAQAIMVKQQSQEITITASGVATQDVSNFIPAGVMVVGFTARVTTAIGGATSLSVGETGSANLWINAMGVVLNATGDLAKATATAPKIYAAATTVRLTANGGNFNGTGKVRLTVHYISLEAPAS